MFISNIQLFTEWKNYFEITANIDNYFVIKSCSKNLTSILVPRFDLCISQVELWRQFHTILDGQVFLALEALFQRLQLKIRESRSGFAILFRFSTSAAVRIVARRSVAVVWIVVVIVIRITRTGWFSIQIWENIKVLL